MLRENETRWRYKIKIQVMHDVQLVVYTDLYLHCNPPHLPVTFTSRCFNCLRERLRQNPNSRIQAKTFNSSKLWTIKILKCRIAKHDSQTYDQRVTIMKRTAKDRNDAIYFTRYFCRFAIKNKHFMIRVQWGAEKLISSVQLPAGCRSYV
jgi:hypothetical protein